MHQSPLFLYIHIPYCLSRCSYCDFVTFEKDKLLPSSEYIKFVKKEIYQQAKFFNHTQVKTIYFGGGTPSLLPSQEIEDILKALKKNFFISPQAEVTIEINPGTLDKKKLEHYIQAGINRFSLGVQTFNEWFLKISRRFHSAEDSLRTLELFKKKNLNFSLDLMFGLPQQGLEDLKKDVYQALAFDPPHVSLYNLTLAPKHPLNKNRADENIQREMFEWIELQLKTKDLIKYEISNFAKQGRTSKHNQAYWKGNNVLGLGLSAHSYLKPHFPYLHHEDRENQYGIRFWNASKMKQYFNQICNPSLKSPFHHLQSSQFEILKSHESLTDFCYTRLRTTEGLSLEELQDLYPQELCQHVSSKLKILLKKKWLEQTRSSFKLSKEGEILSNQVFLALTFSQKDFHFGNNPLYLS